MAEDDPTLCEFCRRGHVIERTQDIAVHQSSDKGYVHCRVTLPVLFCEACGSITSAPGAEDLIEEAFRRAYNALP
jgi:hypothetical protein